MTILLVGQEVNPVPQLVETSPLQKLKLRGTPLSPHAMLKAMVAQERANRAQADATVEVIGFEEEAVLKLLAVDAAEHVRLTFRSMDRQGQRELYAFMNQDPTRPAPLPFVPRMAGGPSAKPSNDWHK